MSALMSLALCYLILGLVANLLAAERRIRFAARLIVLFGWPWVIWNEATPRMAAFLRWAEKR